MTRTGSRRVRAEAKEPWARVYEGLLALVLEHRHEYGLDIARNPVLAGGVAAILRGLEVLLDAEGRSPETTRRWLSLDRVATFAGWEQGLEGAEVVLWRDRRQSGEPNGEPWPEGEEVLYPILAEIEADTGPLFTPESEEDEPEKRPVRRIRPHDWI